MMVQMAILPSSDARQGSEAKMSKTAVGCQMTKAQWHSSRMPVVRQYFPLVFYLFECRDLGSATRLRRGAEEVWRRSRSDAWRRIPLLGLGDKLRFPLESSSLKRAGRRIFRVTTNGLIFGESGLFASASASSLIRSREERPRFRCLGWMRNMNSTRSCSCRSFLSLWRKYVGITSKDWIRRGKGGSCSCWWQSLPASLPHRFFLGVQTANCGFCLSPTGVSITSLSALSGCFWLLSPACNICGKLGPSPRDFV